MRTTLELPDELFRELKSMAAQRGMSLKQVVRVAVERELFGESQPSRERRVEFPILDSKEPGRLHLSNADIEDLLA